MRGARLGLAALAMVAGMGAQSGASVPAPDVPTLYQPRHLFGKSRIGGYRYPADWDAKRTAKRKAQRRSRVFNMMRAKGKR